MSRKKHPFGVEWTLWDVEAGRPVLDFDSFISVNLSDSGSVMNIQVEQGGFAAYNKTETPVTATVNLGVMRGGAERVERFLEDLKRLKSSVATFSLVTPDAEYPNMTLENYSYDRNRESGSSSVNATLSLKEIREVSPKYTITCKMPDMGQDVDFGQGRSKKSTTVKSVLEQSKKTSTKKN